MPELPEMENYRRLLSQSILNVPITNVVVNREKSLNVTVDEFTSVLKGSKVILWNVEASTSYSICITEADCRFT